MSPPSTVILEREASVCNGAGIGGGPVSRWRDWGSPTTSRRGSASAGSHRRTRTVSFAGAASGCGRAWARQPIDVTIVAGSVQLSQHGKVIRVHPIRHDRSRELGAFATAHGRPRRTATGQVLGGCSGSACPWCCSGRVRLLVACVPFAPQPVPEPPTAPQARRSSLAACASTTVGCVSNWSKSIQKRELRKFLPLGTAPPGRGMSGPSR